jgi:hypothetical protein
LLPQKIKLRVYSYRSLQQTEELVSPADAGDNQQEKQGGFTEPCEEAMGCPRKSPGRGACQLTRETQQR